MEKMVVVRAWEVEGRDIPPPHERRIRVLVAPDLHGVPNLMCSQVIIAPFSQTDFHMHNDLAELMYFFAGRGEAVSEAETIPLEPDTLLWIPKLLRHQIKNTGPETLKFLAVFAPPMTAAENYGRALAISKEDKSDS